MLYEKILNYIFEWAKGSIKKYPRIFVRSAGIVDVYPR